MIKVEDNDKGGKVKSTRTLIRFRFAYHATKDLYYVVA